ncbi:hypothetical protein [Lederbergia citri]|uniref:Uncharacterized protein n=1 Tax=Lederbergia citri TaxID=2833580 RepID=A0A942TEH6_9BACI|nr:hypothetical protein [Lederbergia citri]MBS4196410.1 hypothetical protein [Lederbergia citri]
MTTNQFVRSFGVMGVLGFVITVISVIINIATGAESLVGNYLNILGLVLILFGVMAAYFSQSVALGVFGFIGFIVMFIGSIWTIGIVEINSFSYPVINDLNSSMNIGELANSELPSPIKEAMMTSNYLGGVGSVLFGLAILMKGNIMRWPGLLLILAGVASFFESMNEFFGFIGFILSLVAVLWMSIKVLKTNNIS